jgi:hypothetical protein
LPRKRQQTRQIEGEFPLDFTATAKDGRIKNNTVVSIAAPDFADEKLSAIIVQPAN